MPNYWFALIGSLFLRLVGVLLQYSFTRYIIKSLVRQPGEGPSRKSMNEGYLKTIFYGKGKLKNSSNIITVFGRINILDGDAAYK